MKWVLGLLLTCSLLVAETGSQHGTLISVTDSRSNRVIGSNGDVQTVTDVEYRLSIAVGDMVLVGSYWPRWKWSYAPTDLVVNDPVDVRLSGKFMYLKRPDGKELKLKIIQRIRKTTN